jgi:hypothetical protein
MKPFPNRTSTFQRIRLSPVTALLLRVMSFSVSLKCPSGTRPWSISSMTAEALRPATALPVALGGRHSTGYYGLSAPVSALVISRPILTEAGYWFRRCSCRKFCAAVGALWTPLPGVPGLELATLDVRPRWLPLSSNRESCCGAGRVPIPTPCFVPLPLSHRREDHDYRVSQVRQFSLTLAASVTWASWGYGSPAPLARVPTKLDLMPTARGLSSRHRVGQDAPALPGATSFACITTRPSAAPMGFHKAPPTSPLQRGRVLPRRRHFSARPVPRPLPACPTRHRRCQT